MDVDYAAFKRSSDGRTSQVGKWFFQRRCVHVRCVAMWEQRGRQKEVVLRFITLKQHVDSCFHYLSDKEE